MATRKLVVEIVGDASSLERSFSRASRSSRGFESGLGKASRGALAASLSFRGLGRSLAFASTSFVGGAGIAFLGKQIITETSRVQEEIEKTGVVFGKNAGQVQAWSKTLAQSFGISEGAALEATGRFGNMLRPLGFGTAAAAKMSERLVQLAADLASFNNAKPEDVLAALSSGLAGQVRPLRQYGVFLTQARIANEAVADGLSKTGKNLSQATKLHAAYNIILKDTKNAQGDVARNTGSLSVAQSKLTAGIQDTETRLGTALLPLLTQYTNKVAAWLNTSKNQERIQRDVTSAINAAVTAVRDISAVFRTASGAVGGFGNLVKIIIGLKFAQVLLGWAAAARRLQAALIALNSASLAASLGNVGASAATSTPLLAKMLGQVRALARVATISIAFRFPGLAAGLAGLAGLTAAVAAATAAGVLAASGAASTDIPDLPTAGFRADLVPLAESGKIPESVLRAGAKQAGIDPNTPAGKAFANPEFVAFIFAWAKAKGLIQPVLPDEGTLKKMARAAGIITDTTKSATAATSRPGLTVTQRNQFFDAGIDRDLGRVQDISSVQGQIGRLQQIADLITKRLAKTKDITRRLNLEDKLLDVFRQIKSDRAQVAQNLIDALQLGVTKAQATEGTRDDIAALNALQAGIRARIKSEGDSVDLESQLFDVQQQLVAVRKQNQQSLVDLLQFKVTKAAATSGFGDDLAALSKLQAALKSEIKATGSTLDLQQQLFEAQSRLKAAKTSALVAKDFKALGFGPTGDALVPGKDHLKKLLASVTDSIGGTSLDTAKVKSQLKVIRKELTDSLVPPEIRSKMQELLSDLNQKLKSNAGNLARSGKINANALAKSLGLDPEQTRQLRAKLSRVSAAGTVPGVGRGAFGTPLPVTAGAGGPPIVVHTDVHLDRHKVGTAVTSFQQKGRRRNPVQKRGPHAGGD